MRFMGDFKRRVLWTAAALATLTFSYGQLAQALPLSKDEQKCVNELNKGGSKVAKALGGDIDKCVKFFGKGKLTTTAEECLTADGKGKVAKALGKLETKGSDKCAGQNPAFGATDPNTQAVTLQAMELSLIHDLFGSDLDSSLVLAMTDKDEAKCQAGIAKQLVKCANAHLSSFNACKKDGIKGKTLPQIEGSLALQDCLSEDPKGKIAKDCGAKLSSAVGKCGAVDTDPLFPGCTAQDLATCVAATVKSATDAALTTVDNLGVIGQSICEFAGVGSEDPNVSDCFCVGGDDDGEPCEDATFHTECEGSPPTSRCICAARAELANAIANPILTFAIPGQSTIECGTRDPNTGIAACQCDLTEKIELVIGSTIGVACLTPAPAACAPELMGQLDCDGGTPLDLAQISDHSVGDIAVALDPNQFIEGPFCNVPDPNNGNPRCSDMCDVYCANEPDPDDPNLPGNFVQFLSGCEGFCRGGFKDGETCASLDDCCTGGDCATANLDNSGLCVGASNQGPAPHAGHCTCTCVEVGGAPSLPGGFLCYMGIRTVLETLDITPDGDECDGLDVYSVQGDQCLVVTTEGFTNIQRTLDLVFFTSFEQNGTGTRATCEELAVGNTSSLAQVGAISAYDGGLGDNSTLTLQTCK